MIPKPVLATRVWTIRASAPDHCPVHNVWNPTVTPAGRDDKKTCCMLSESHDPLTEDVRALGSAGCTSDTFLMGVQLYRG